MSTTQVVNGSTAALKPGAAVSSSKLPYSDVWTMHYFKGGSPNQLKNFIHDGDFKSAYEVAKKHCVKNGFRLMYIKPFITDLDADTNVSKNENQIPS